MRNKQEVFKLILFSVLTICIFFLSLELIQRVRWYFKSDGSTYWLLYGFVSKPKNYAAMLCRIADKHNKIREIEIYEKLFPNGIKKHNPLCSKYGKINSLGFRSYEFDPVKVRDTYRIIATGASTTAGYESDIDHTWPALLQKELNSSIKSEVTFEVINAGKGAEDMGYINTLLEIELAAYDPDMVILYLTFNHLHKRRGSINVPKDIFYALYKLKEWMSDKSLLFLTLRERIVILRGKTCGDIYIPANSSKSLAKGFLNTPEAFSSYRESLERYIAICRNHNIVPVFVTEACVLGEGSYMLLGKDMEPVYKKMYSIMKDVAKENNIILIDAARIINEIPGSEKLFPDRLHLYPEGNKVLADIIFEGIKGKIEEEVR